MIDEPTNIFLGHLRRIDRKVDGVATDMQQVVLRLGSIERHLAGVCRDRSHQGAAGSDRAALGS